MVPSARFLVLVLLVGVACSPAAPAAPGPAAGPTGAPAEEIAEAITLGYPVSLPSLDPHPVVAQTGAFAFDPIYDQLVRYDRTGKLVPWLATAWRAVDRTTWEFTLREGVKFSNGEPFDASVAKWNFDRFMAPETRAIERPTFATVERVEASSPTVLRVVTRTDDPLLVRRFNLLRMIPPKHFEQVGAGAFQGLGAVGTGPYKVVDYVAGDRVVFEGWDGSWRGKGKTRRITLRFTPDRTTLAAGVRTGDLDGAFDLMADQIIALRQAGFNVTEGIFPGAWYMEFNTVASPPLRDRRVRLALNYAIDREGIAKTLFRGLVTPAWQMASPNATGYQKDLPPYPYDPAKAKDLLAEAGYAGGFKLKAGLTAGGRTFSEAVAGMWKELGVELELQLLDFAVFVEKSNAGPIDDILVSRSTDGDVRDVDAAYQFVGNAANRPAARISWQNDQFVQLYQQQRSETDPARREALLKQLVRLVYDEAPVAPVYYPLIAWVTSSKLKDVSAAPDTSLDLQAIYRLK
ncbi:MAG: ABC transporter substrate-binding protein [Chloroflexi bacterium]|nr:ABC transporter substrate-binding protein [Chloroflexota bacterium]